jgi:cytochrome c-type biogenesis protein CcmH/NrfG
LGATQANSARSADAVHAYRRALSLRPTYVRALANLAISYANQVSPSLSASLLSIMCYMTNVT